MMKIKNILDCRNIEEIRDYCNGWRNKPCEKCCLIKFCSTTINVETIEEKDLAKLREIIRINRKKKLKKLLS